MKKVAALTALLLCCAWPSSGVPAFDPEKVTGPRIERLCLVIVANADA